jgi:hypothetical protein
VISTVVYFVVYHVCKHGKINKLEETTGYRDHYVDRLRNRCNGTNVRGGYTAFRQVVPRKTCQLRHVNLQATCVSSEVNFVMRISPLERLQASLEGQ